MAMRDWQSKTIKAGVVPSRGDYLYAIKRRVQSLHGLGYERNIVK